MNFSPDINGVQHLQYIGSENYQKRAEEVDAFKAGFSLWGSYPVDGTKMVKEITEITLKQIRDNKNNQPYIGLFP